MNIVEKTNNPLLSKEKTAKEKATDMKIDFLDSLFRNSIDGRIVENIAKYNPEIYYYVGLMCDSKRKYKSHIHYYAIDIYRKSVSYLKAQIHNIEQTKKKENNKKKTNEKENEEQTKEEQTKEEQTKEEQTKEEQTKEEQTEKERIYEMRNVSMYNLADLLELKRHFEEAKAIATELIEYDCDGYFILGSIANKEGNIEDAIKYLEKGIELGSKRGYKLLLGFYFNTNKIEKLTEFCIHNGEHNENETLRKWFNAKLLEYIEKRTIVGRFSRDEVRLIYDNADISMLSLASQYNIGDDFAEGKYTHRDRKEAEKIFQRLSDDYNDCDSQNMLAEIYRFEYTSNVMKNEEMQKRSEEMYVKSAYNGSYASCKHLLSKYKHCHSDADNAEYDKLLKHAMTLITHPDQKNINILNSSTTIDVKITYLKGLFDQLKNLEARVLEYELRPPVEGGRLYREAQNDFYKNIAVISLKK